MSSVKRYINPLYGNGTGYNKTLRVLFAKNQPDAFSNCPIFPTLSPTFQCPFPGWCVEILKMICDALHVYIEEYVYDNNVGQLNWGTKVNGTWQGVLGYLQNDTVDVACLMYQMTTDREASFDFSYPVTNVQPVYVVRQASTSVSSVLWNAFKPFSLPVWMTFIGTFFVSLFWMIIVTRAEYAVKIRKRFRPLETCWHVLQLQLDERSEDMIFASLGGNIILFVFALMQSGLMMELYKGMILSSLLSSGSTSPFQNADQMVALVAAKKYSLVSDYIGLWYFVDIYESNSTHFVDLREAIKDNPIKVVDTADEALDLVETGKYIFPIQQDGVEMQLAQSRCDLVYVSQGLPQVSSYYVFRKNNSIFKEFSHQIIMQQPFIQHTFNKYFESGFEISGKVQQCPKKKGSDDDNDGVDDSEDDYKAIDMASMIGVFTIGIIGLGISILVFFLELYIRFHQKVINTRVQSITHYLLHIAFFIPGIGNLVSKVVHEREIVLEEQVARSARH